MNVLILTPDAVGSTLLQRLITVYMQFYNYGKPVINLHELSNGLVKYYNNSLQQEVLGKKGDCWGYHQGLQEIVNLLDNADHYKTSRLAHYHIKNRQDSIEQQVPFYQYLNDNFYIISCRRHNVFEHALSWALNKVTKKLNVYSTGEKVDTFMDFYKNGINLDPNSLIQTLDAYKEYISWCNNHFNVANYFYYDEHLNNIENYISALPIFPSQHRITWKEKFGISFNHWNQCHYATSDIGSIALNSPEQFAQLTNDNLTSDFNNDFLISYRNVSDPSWPEINLISEYHQISSTIQHEVEQHFHVTVPKVGDLLTDFLPAEQQDFFNQHKESYFKSRSQIVDFVRNGIMHTSIPIKKQTLAEKKYIVNNYHQLIDVYNQWIDYHPDIGAPLTEETLDKFAQLELDRWGVKQNLTNRLSVSQIPD